MAEFQLNLAFEVLSTKTEFLIQNSHGILSISLSIIHRPGNL